MNRLKLLGAAALLTVVAPLATASTGHAQSGPGSCTPPGDYAVGAAGPAMNGGQLMAGVGQCRNIGSAYRSPGYGYRYGYRSDAYGWQPNAPYAGPGY